MSTSTLLPNSATTNPPADAPTPQPTKPTITSPFPLKKEDAGQAYWKVLHSYAYSYPESATQQDADNFKIVFLNVMKSFPCDECKSHAKEYFIKNPPPLNSRKELVRWFCDFHNSVNKKLNKPEQDCSVMVESPANEKPCTSCAVSPAKNPINNIPSQQGSTSTDEKPIQPQTPMKDLQTTFKDYKAISTKIIEELCKRESLPIPDIVYRPCPEAPETSCTSIYRDPQTKTQIRKPLIYLNPNVYALRTIVHEFFHYAETMKGHEDLAMDEFAVEKMAQEIIAKEFPYDNNPSALSHLQPVKKIEVMNAKDEAVAGVGQPIVVQPVQQQPVIQQQEQPRPVRRLSVMERFQLIKEARRRKYKVKKQTEEEPPMTVAESPTAVDPNNPQQQAMTVEAATQESKFPTYQMIRQRYEAERFAEAKDGDDQDGFFSGFDQLYAPVAPHLGLPPRTLNEAFTANFISNSVTTIAKSNLSPIGSLLFTSVGGTGLMLSNFILKSQTGVALGDRKMMTNIAANLMMNALNYANPKVSKKILRDAKKIGGHIASFEFDKILPMLIESPFLKKGMVSDARRRRDRRYGGGGYGGGGGSGPSGPSDADPAGGGIGGGLSAPTATLGGQIAAQNVQDIPGAGVVATGGGSVFSPTIVPGNPQDNFFTPAPSSAASSIFDAGTGGPGGVFAEAGPPHDPFYQGLGSSFAPGGFPPDLESMSFNERLRYIERMRGVGGREAGRYYGFNPGSERHGQDFGIVQPRAPRIMEDEEAFGSLGSSDHELPPELAPYDEPFLNPEEEELFGGRARADMYGVRRNSIGSYYDDLSDLR